MIKLVFKSAREIDPLLEQIEISEKRLCEAPNHHRETGPNLINRTVIAQIDQALTGPGGRFTLGCGLKATAYRLDNPKVTNEATTIMQYINRGREPSFTPQHLVFYYTIAIKNFGATIYLMFMSLGAPADVLSQLHKKILPISALKRLLWVVYENSVHTMYSRTGQLLLKAIDNKTNPKIVALIEKLDEAEA